MNEERFGYDDYLSPFTWRYGSPEMRSLFSESHRRATWRRVWLALAEAESRRGLISEVELRNIRAHSGKDDVDVKSAHDLERSIKHDLMAELRVFAGQTGKGGGKLHLGATSMDIEDNADVVIALNATSLLLSRLARCLAALRKQILKHKNTVCIGWTHLQPAEPTTLGYRLSAYAQDLVLDVQLIETVKSHFLKGKGVKGAVGTSASFKALLGTDGSAKELETSVMKKIGVEPFDIATQTYPRKADYVLLSALASVAQSCHKFGLDLRVMQSPAFGEISEPIGEKQVGSSAMPFKRNPITAERMCSLARYVSVLPGIAFVNAANSILERTLDDSAARRIALPEAFLAVDECLTIYERLAEGMRVYPEMIRNNLEKFGAFAGTEALLMRAVERGGDRQELHERIRRASFKAWERVMQGEPNPLEGELAKDKSIVGKVKRNELHDLMDATNHIGNAPSKCEDFVKEKIDPAIAKYRGKRSRTETRY